jgi:hypothetical protein
MRIVGLYGGENRAAHCIRQERLLTKNARRCYAIRWVAVGLVAVLLAATSASAQLLRDKLVETDKDAKFCSLNLKQTLIAFRSWTFDHGEQFPFNISENAGGSYEKCQRDAAGVDTNGYIHLSKLSAQWLKPDWLVCPSDHRAKVASTIKDLSKENVTYQVHSGKEVEEVTPLEWLMRCPIHGTVLIVYGDVLTDKEHAMLKLPISDSTVARLEHLLKSGDRRTVDLEVTRLLLLKPTDPKAPKLKALLENK